MDVSLARPKLACARKRKYKYKTASVPLTYHSPPKTHTQFCPLPVMTDKVASKAVDVDELLQNALDAVRGAAVGPQPQDPYRAHQWEMAGAHAMFLHSLRGIYEVRTTDVAP